MFLSLTTKDTKVGTVQYLIEKIVLSTKKPPENFWSKKKCKDLDLDLYRINTTLYLCLRSVIKSYGEEIVVAAVSSFNYKQLRKIYQLARYQNNVGQIIAGFKFYCEGEKARDRRVAAPKDETDADPLVFKVGIDLRKPRIKNKKINLWETLLNNKRSDSF